MASIFFLIDHKHRDLPISISIGSNLEKLGINVHYYPINDKNIEKDISLIEPDAIVIPKPNFNQSETFFWKLKGIKLIVVETEGNHQDKNVVYRVFNKPSLYLTWNHEVANLYKKIFKNQTTVKVCGFHRGDLLHKSFRSIFGQRDDNLLSLNLDPNNFNITIATSTHISHLSKSRLEKQSQRRKAKFSSITDIYDIFENQLMLRNMTEELISKLLEVPDINIILKPHPNENVIYWNKYIKNLNNPRIKLLTNQSINYLLTFSDLHIAHNVCTTTIEAMMMDIPAIELHGSLARNLYKKEHLELANICSEDTDNIYKKIIQIKNKDLKFNDAKIKLDEYVAKYFFKFDGMRSHHYAKEIVRFLDSNNEDSKFLFAIKNLHILIFLLIIKIKNFIVNFFGRKKRIDEINNPTNRLSNVTKINDVLVDKEFGLSDNRCDTDDIAFWKNKFS